MRTLIVPCAGSREVNNLPIFLNRHPKGEILALRAIQGINPEKYNRIVFSLLKDVEEKYNISHLLVKANNNRYPLETIILDQKTNGPAETVYKTIKQGNIDGEFAVRDSHAYIRINSDPRGNYVAGLDLTKFEKPIENLKDKSFIVLNEQGQTLDVVEKHFCSDVISAGLYGFRSTDDYLMAYEHLNDPNYPIKKLFVSHIISYLIGYKQRVFHSVPVVEFEDWASKSTWQQIQKKYATVFLDVDELFKEDPRKELSILKSLKQLSDSGVTFICFSARSSNAELEEILNEHRIKILNTVYNCPFSKEKVLARKFEDIGRMVLEL